MSNAGQETRSSSRSTVWDKMASNNMTSENSMFQVARVNI